MTKIWEEVHVGIERESNSDIRSKLKQRLEVIQELARKLPLDDRQPEVGPDVYLTSHDHGPVQILRWTAQHYNDDRAQALIGEVGRSAMLLILTIFIGIWYQATSEKRRKFISDYRSRQP